MAPASPEERWRRVSLLQQQLQTVCGELQQVLDDRVRLGETLEQTAAQAQALQRQQQPVPGDTVTHFLEMAQKFGKVSERELQLHDEFDALLEQLQLQAMLPASQ